MYDYTLSACVPEGLIRVNSAYMEEAAERNFKQYGGGLGTDERPFMAAAANPHSVVFHELVHVWQFEQFELLGLKTRAEREKFLKNAYKKMQRELGLSDEELLNISFYTEEMLKKGNYAEVHAELWTYKVLVLEVDNDNSQED